MTLSVAFFVLYYKHTGRKSSLSSANSPTKSVSTLEPHPRKRLCPMIVYVFIWITAENRTPGKDNPQKILVTARTHFHLTPYEKLK